MTPPVPSPIVRERLLTPEEVAEWLQVDRGWVIRHAMLNAADPRITCVKLGRDLRFRREDIEQFVAEQFEAARHRAPQGKEISSLVGVLGRRKS